MSVTLPDIEAEQAALQVLARCDVLAAISESPRRADSGLSIS